ncbi:hypothetical protein QBC43DRAFT_49402 [Cladorrhinum sp. PSN259]|nr:hypothetical protein QBC43DRAFT_49402 [Cladorrhinum sp. PSN259]
MAASQVFNAFDPQLESRLVDLPLEMLLRITYHIPTPDLANVRLTCKALESKLFKYFAQEFFRKKQFMVSKSSLQALIDISKHPNLGPVLEHLIIATDRPGNGFFNGGNSSAADAASKKLNLQIAQAEAKIMMSGGLCRDMLAEAFSNLPNLQIVDLRDFNSHSRNRDGFGSPWRSFGSVILSRSIAAPVTTHPINYDDDYASSLFVNITTALATANVRPQNIEVLLRNRNWSLFDWAFEIPPHLDQSFVSLLSGIKTLHLSLSMRQAPLTIRKFLSYAKNVTWLRINFNHVSAEESEALFSWLALTEGEEDPNYTTIPDLQVKGISFPHIERFDIGTADIWPLTLLNVIKKFAPTLRDLSLRRLSLKERYGSSMLEDKVSPWPRFLDNLLKVPNIQLRVLDLSQLSHIAPNGWRGSVSFAPSADSKNRDFKGDTSLATLQSVVRAAKDAMVPEWPYEPPAADNDDDDDDHEEEDEEEDEDDEMDDDNADDDDVVLGIPGLSSLH